MQKSDADRVNEAYEMIIKSIKNNIDSVNEEVNALLKEMEGINDNLMLLTSNTTDPAIARKVKELFSDPEVLYYYQLLQVLRNIPKRKKEEASKQGKK